VRKEAQGLIEIARRDFQEELASSRSHFLVHQDMCSRMSQQNKDTFRMNEAQIGIKTTTESQ